MDASLDGWRTTEFAHGGRSRPVLRRGSGPGVVVVHEIPGITPTVAAFAERVVDAGFSVAMPLLVGEVGRPPSAGYLASSFAKVCVSREFTTMALRRTSPVVGWLRGLASALHSECGGPGVGAIGMCFSGGFALGMMVEPAVVAPVLSQPSLPFAVGAARAADLNLDPADEAVVVARASEGCSVLGLRFTGDRLVGTRFDSLRALLGDAFVAVEFESRTPRDHSVLTEQLEEDGVRAVLDFLRARLSVA